MESPDQINIDENGLIFKTQHSTGFKTMFFKSGEHYDTDLKVHDDVSGVEAPSCQLKALVVEGLPNFLVTSCPSPFHQGKGDRDYPSPVPGLDDVHIKADNDLRFTFGPIRILIS